MKDRETAIYADRIVVPFQLEKIFASSSTILKSSQLKIAKTSPIVDFAMDTSLTPSDRNCYPGIPQEASTATEQFYNTGLLSSMSQMFGVEMLNEIQVVSHMQIHDLPDCNTAGKLFTSCLNHKYHRFNQLNPARVTNEIRQISEIVFRHTFLKEIS